MCLRTLNCQKVHIREIGCSFGVVMKEHQKEQELEEEHNCARCTLTPNPNRSLMAGCWAVIVRAQ